MDPPQMSHSISVPMSSATPASHIDGQMAKSENDIQQWIQKTDSICSVCHLFPVFKRKQKCRHKRVAVNPQRFH